MFLAISKLPFLVKSGIVRRKHSASQTDDEDMVPKTLELSPEQAFTDIDKEFVDRRQQITPTPDNVEQCGKSPSNTA